MKKRRLRKKYRVFLTRIQTILLWMITTMVLLYLFNKVTDFVIHFKENFLPFVDLLTIVFCVPFLLIMIVTILCFSFPVFQKLHKIILGEMKIIGEEFVEATTGNTIY